MKPSDVGHAAAHAASEIVTAVPTAVCLLCRRIRSAVRSCHGPDPGVPCLPIPEGVWLRPDAYLYSQRLLMGLGMAVTWDNPDVTLTDMAGNVVGSHDLLPSTDYRITAQIHNKSPDAPAPGLPVVFTLLSFGAGGPPRQSIGSTVINLPVRAAPGEPAAASVVWTTPAVPDHYCIEIDCSWPDDAFPIDNVGQHNTVIRKASADEQLLIEIPIWQVRDEAHEHLALSIGLDGYQLPSRPLLRREDEPGETFAERIKRANLAELHEADPQWAPSLSAHTVSKSSGSTSVTFSATVPATASSGDRAHFNISVNDPTGNRVVGGATVIVQVA